ncbi:MAG: carboxypeptidase-like regulatory domain-containing protein [Bacteroidales bacterium]
MNLYKYILVTLFVTVLTILPTRGQIKLSGRVTNQNDEPIELAIVRVKGTSLGTMTDLKGLYSLNIPKAANDSTIIEFSCLGYSNITRQYIDARGDINLNVRMYNSSRALTELEVVEYKKQTSAMSLIDANIAKLTPDASGGSIEAMLTTMGGVSSKNEMSSQYMVRGGSYDENSVYINGIEVYRPLLISSGQQEGLSIINPDMVGQVAFSTGGFSSEYGDKMSSVLDITYRDPEKLEGSLSASLMGGSVSFGQSSKNFSQLHGVRYKRNTSLLSTLETKGEYDPEYFDYQTIMRYSVNKKLDISFLGNIAVNNYSFVPQDRETSFGTMTNAKQFTVYFDGEEADRFETYFGALSLDYKVNDKSWLQFLASGYLTNELVTYDIAGEYWLDEAGSSSYSDDGADATTGGELGVGKYHEHARNRLKASVMAMSVKGATTINKHTVEYGATLQSEYIYENAREWEWRDSAGYSLPHTGNGVNVVYNLNSNQELNSARFALYAQDSYKAQHSSGLYVINGGVRASYYSFNNEFLLSPRVSLGFVPAANEQFSFRLASGIYYQSPFYKEYRVSTVDEDGNTQIELNDDIKSQRSIQLILGGDYTFRAMNRPFKVSTEIYYKNLDNLISYEIDNLKIVYSGYNDSQGYIAGVDFKLFGQFVPGTDSWISLSLMKTQEELNGVKVPRATDQRYNLAVFFQDYFPKFPRMKFSLKGVLSDGMPVTAPNTTRDEGYFRTPSYKRVDIGVSYCLVGGDEPSSVNTGSGFFSNFKSIWLGVDLFNLLDISNVSSYYWVTDVNDNQYAVPNYLTGRQINVRLNIAF